MTSRRVVVLAAAFLPSFFCLFLTSQQKLQFFGRYNASLRIASIRWAVVKSVGTYFRLMIEVTESSPLWVVPYLGR